MKDQSNRRGIILGVVCLSLLMLLMLSSGSSAEPGRRDTPAPQRTHEPIYCGWVGPVWVCVP